MCPPLKCWGRFCLYGFLCLAFLVSCHPRSDSHPVLVGASLADAQRNDSKTLKTIEHQNRGVRKEFIKIKSTGKWTERGYFSAEESNQLEYQLDIFHFNHRLLIGMIDRYRDRSKTSEALSVAGEKLAAESQKLRTQAHRQLVEQARFLVNAFEGDSVAIDKVNQRYPRAGVPKYTYDRLADLLRSAPSRQVALISRKVEEEWDDSSYGLQAELVTQVGRFKNPAAHLIQFSESQKQRVVGLLQPGDIILTYTSGYASTVFIPGAFKHAMVYVGTVEQRRAIGLTPQNVHLHGGARARLKLDKNLAVPQTKEGREANVIEAQFKGVKFSDLNHMMGTHMNRMAVLRPLLSDRDRLTFLTQIFSYLGQEYDFRFDFTDSSRQVCTEIVYRSLSGLNGIEFTLSRHTGHLTLSSDDIIRYALERRSDAFDFVLYVDESPLSSRHAARIRTGEVGLRRLKLQMKP